MNTNANTYLFKCYVCGKLPSEDFTSVDQNGNKINTYTLILEKMHFCSPWCCLKIAKKFYDKMES